MKTRRWLLATTLALVAADLDGATAAEEVPAGQVQYLDQGWSETARTWFYNTTQGSRLIPYRWFLALEQPNAEGLFRDERYMAPFGYLPSLDEGENPDRLPIGFVADGVRREDAFEAKRPLIAQGFTLEQFRLREEALARNAAALPRDGDLVRTFKEGDVVLDATEPLAPPPAKRPDLALFPEEEQWLGMTCAACHTAQFEYNGRKFRVDGGPAMADFTTFSERLKDALEKTVENGNKFERFAARVLGPGASDPQKEDLLKRLESLTASIRGLVIRSHPTHPYGHGRLDAFGILLNEIVGRAMNLPENLVQPNAPVSYPPLWDTPDLEWVQWNGASHSPLARNIGQVLGVFADLNLTNPDPNQLTTSANLTNLFRLEEHVKSLRPPRWPDQIFGPINRELAQAGEGIYRAFGCAECHPPVRPYPMTEPNKFGRSRIEVRMIPLTEVRTDPSAALSFLLRKAKPGIFGPAFGQQATVPAPRLLAVTVRQVIAVQFKKLQIGELEQIRYLDRREDKAPCQSDLAAYKARPLAGVWATAPYLHNGSVPNLHELLLPASRRSKAFRVGSRAFDPERVGFVDEGASLIDTTLPGNLNSGHEFGTNLTDQQRRQLLEYLKTL